MAHSYKGMQPVFIKNIGLKNIFKKKLHNVLSGKNLIIKL